jgi:hypothetical protein
MTQYTRSSEHTRIGAVFSVGRATTRCWVRQYILFPLKFFVPILDSQTLFQFASNVSNTCLITFHNLALTHCWLLHAPFGLSLVVMSDIS